MASTRPEAKLNDNPYNIVNLKYPYSLGSDKQSHAVKFRIKEIKSLFDNTTVSFNQLLTAGMEKLAELTEGVDAIDSNEARKEVMENAGKTVDQAKNTMQGAFSTGLNFRPNLSETKAEISLYLPDTLDFQQSFHYNPLNLTEVIRAIGSAIVGGSGGKIKGALGSILQGGGAINLGLNAAGYAINPQQQLLFQGVDFRTFGLAFVMTPWNAQESNTIKEIIKTFRKYGSPTILKNTAGFIFKPPAVFEIEFWSGSKQNEYLNKVTQCVLTQIEVNYAPNGWTAHNDGAPVQTALNLGFQEIEIIDSTKIEGGY
jgi:hypothetical protein